MDYNNLSDQELDQLVTQKIGGGSAAKNNDYSNLSDDDLDRMVTEKLNIPPLDPTDQEASLGIIDRARYSLSPFESNREQQLLNNYGKENVAKDEKGNLYLKQNGKFLPVNKEGASTADFAEFAASIPEVAGGLVGAVTGMGAGSIPLAVAGGAAGSGIRQGLDAIINPDAQVATMGERAIETGLSGATNAIIPVVGKGVKAVYPELKTLASKGLKSIGGLFKSSPVENIAEQEAKNLTETGIDSAAKDSTASVLPYKREAVAGESKYLDEIAKRQNLPESTFAQKSGGDALQAEGRLQDTPLFGKDIAKYVDNQTESVKKNLEKEVGEFLRYENDNYTTGLAIKDMATKSKESVKQISQALYDKVAKEGENAMIGKKTFYNKFRDKAGELGLINPDGSRAVYDTASDLTRDEFNTVQNVLFDGIDAIRKNPSDKIRFTGVNAQVKKISSIAEKLSSSDPNAARILKGFKKELEDTAEDVLNREVPRLGGVFKQARQSWKRFKDDEEFLDGFIPKNGGDEEKLVAKAMSGTANIEKLKTIIGNDAVKEIGSNHVKSILKNLGESGVASASTARKAIIKQAATIKAALGDKAYENIVDNLYYLNRVNRGIGIQRPRLMDLITKIGGWKELGGAIIETGRNTVKANPPGVKNVAKEASKKSAKSVISPARRQYLKEKAAFMRKVKNQSSTSLGNVFSDDAQRGISKKKAE